MPGAVTSSRTTRVIHAGAEAIWEAFTDPVALVAWLPPESMTGRMHAFDARVGGGYSMSLYYPGAEQHVRGKTAEHEDRVEVRFVELDRPRRLVEAVTFVTDDPALQGEMTLTVTIDPVDDGCTVTMLFEQLPPGLRPEDNDAGARASLAQLARLLEG